MKRLLFRAQLGKGERNQDDATTAGESSGTSRVLQPFLLPTRGKQKKRKPLLANAFRIGNGV
jgi:hypothetical protein